MQGRSCDLTAPFPLSDYFSAFAPAGSAARADGVAEAVGTHGCTAACAGVIFDAVIRI